MPAAVGSELGLVVSTPSSDVGRGLVLAVPTLTPIALAVGEGVGASAVSPVPRIGKRRLGLSLHALESSGKSVCNSEFYLIYYVD